MHEFGIAMTIYTQVCEEAEKRNISKISLIGIEVGKMAAIVPDALEFSFEVITKGTFLEGVRLVIEEKPFSAKCEECGHIFEVEDYLGDILFNPWDGGEFVVYTFEFHLYHRSALQA